MKQLRFLFLLQVLSLEFESSPIQQKRYTIIRHRKIRECRVAIDFRRLPATLPPPHPSFAFLALFHRSLQLLLAIALCNFSRLPFFDVLYRCGRPIIDGATPWQGDKLWH